MARTLYQTNVVVRRKLGRGIVLKAYFKRMHLNMEYIFSTQCDKI